MKISSCSAKTISDSRGKPTIEIGISNGTFSAYASVPSGKSAGSREVEEKRDSDGGVKGVIHGIIEHIVPAIVDKEFSSPREIDEILLKLDGTPDKSNLGGNALLGVSIAATKLFALEQKIPVWKFIADTNSFIPQFPRLYMNMMNGGVHGNFNLPFQEYIVIAEGNPKEAYDRATTIFWKLGDLVKKVAAEVSLGDEGGYSPTFTSLEKPFEFLKNLVSKGEGLSLGIDAAASEFCDQGIYTILGQKYSTDDLLNMYIGLIERFGVVSIEDPFAEDDISGFIALTESCGSKTLIVGDDLTVTNPKILQEMVDKKAANAVIVKPNQIGTLSEVYDAVRIAHNAGWKIIASHRSGETNDSFIADLAMGIGAFGFKAGAPTQKERVTKYDRLVQIEDEFSISHF